MEQPLKIAQLTPYYTPVIGGVEVVCQYISEELARRGHEVHVFTANRSHRGSPRLRAPSRETIQRVHVRRFTSYLNVGHYGFFPGLIRPLLKEGFDVVHCHGYRQPQSELGSLIGWRLGVPTLLHVHGGFYTRSKVKRRFYDLFDAFTRRHMASRFDGFIALSEADRDRLLELNVRRERVRIIRNAAEPVSFEAVDAEDFRKKHGLEGKRVILYLSILHHFKRPDLLVRALPGIVAKVPDALLLVAGPDAGELEKLRELADKHRVAKYFKWLGPLRGRDKHQAFECAEFLALPSDEDPYPLVLLEAMAHGTPVLTTDVVGQAPVINSSGAGIIIRPGDVDGIVNASVKLLTDRPYREAVAKNARCLAREMFSAHAVVDEIEMLYRQMIAGRPSISA